MIKIQESGTGSGADFGYGAEKAGEDEELKTNRRRDNKPVILTVDAEKAAADGVKFYIGNDKVCLADQIPPRYLGIK